MVYSGCTGPIGPITNTASVANGVTGVVGPVYRAAATGTFGCTGPTAPYIKFIRGNYEYCAYNSTPNTLTVNDITNSHSYVCTIYLKNNKPAVGTYFSKGIAHTIEIENIPEEIIKTFLNYCKISVML